MSIVTPDTKLGWLIIDGEEYGLINENPLTQEAFDIIDDACPDGAQAFWVRAPKKYTYIIEDNKLYLAYLYLDRCIEPGDTNLIQKIFKRDKVRMYWLQKNLYTELDREVIDDGVKKTIVIKRRLKCFKFYDGELVGIEETQDQYKKRVLRGYYPE